MKILVRTKPVNRDRVYYLFDKDPVKEVYVWLKHGYPTVLYSLKVRVK